MRNQQSVTSSLPEFEPSAGSPSMSFSLANQPEYDKNTLNLNNTVINKNEVNNCSIIGQIKGDKEIIKLNILKTQRASYLSSEQEIFTPKSLIDDLAHVNSSSMRSSSLDYTFEGGKKSSISSQTKKSQRRNSSQKSSKQAHQPSGKTKRQHPNHAIKLEHQVVSVIFMSSRLLAKFYVSDTIHTFLARLRQILPTVEGKNIIGLYYLQFEEESLSPNGKSPRTPGSAQSTFSKDLIQAPIDKSQLIQKASQIKSENTYLLIYVDSLFEDCNQKIMNPEKKLPGYVHSNSQIPISEKLAHDQIPLNQTNEYVLKSKGTTNNQMFCPYSQCMLQFKHIGNLKAHIYVHSGVRPHSCTFEGCNKSFQTKGHLQNHELIHTGEKPYACQFCGKKYQRGNRLKIHVRTHTNDKPYECHVCLKKFTEGGNLKTHMLIHSGIKPFRCEADGCSKTFATQSHLINHRNHHRTKHPIEERENQCHICSKKFLDSKSLFKHQKLQNCSNSSSKVYACEFCRSIFTGLESLISHKTICKPSNCYNNLQKPQVPSRISNSQTQGNLPSIKDNLNGDDANLYSLGRTRADKKKLSQFMNQEPFQDYKPASKRQQKADEKNQKKQKLNYSAFNQRSDVSFGTPQGLNGWESTTFPDPVKSQPNQVNQSSPGELFNQPLNQPADFLGFGGNQAFQNPSQIRSPINRPRHEFEQLNFGDPQMQPLSYDIKSITSDGSFEKMTSQEHLQYDNHPISTDMNQFNVRNQSNFSMHNMSQSFQVHQSIQSAQLSNNTAPYKPKNPKISICTSDELENSKPGHFTPMNFIAPQNSNIHQAKKSPLFQQKRYQPSLGFSDMVQQVNSLNRREPQSLQNDQKKRKDPSSGSDRSQLPVSQFMLSRHDVVTPAVRDMGYQKDQNENNFTSYVSHIKTQHIERGTKASK